MESINLSNFNLQNVKDMRSMFGGCASLKSIDLSPLNVKKVENISGLFSNCFSLETIGFSNFNTENVKDMSDLFSFCHNLKNIDLSKFNTKKVTNFNSMFNQCKALEKINLSNFNTENVTSMEYMFGECVSLKEVDLSSFNTQNVEKMGFMFDACEELVKVNLSNFNISKADINAMFYQCTKLTKEGIITKENKIKEQFEKDTGFNKYTLPYINREIAEKYCKSHNIGPTNNIWGQSKTFNYSTNPIKGWSFEKQNTGENKALTKQDLYIKLADIKDPKLRDDIENILKGGKPSDAFLKMLNDRYNKHKAEFETKWAEYQVAKGNKATLKSTMLKLEEKYKDSESDYENSKVKHAQKDYKNAEIDADVLLSVVLYMSHDAVIM